MTEPPSYTVMRRLKKKNYSTHLLLNHLFNLILKRGWVLKLEPSGGDWFVYGHVTSVRKNEIVTWGKSTFLEMWKPEKD